MIFVIGDLDLHFLVAINDGPTRMHHDGRLNKLDLIIERMPRRL